MFKFLAVYLTACSLLVWASPGQQASPGTSKPTEHVIGTVTAIDNATHAITVKEDKTGTEHNVLLQNTKTLLKVSPGAKDLKSAVRITPNDLAVGDRVDVRGSKPEDNPSAIAARSVVLMSARDLQQAHQAEAEAWQQSTAGLVSSVDTTGEKLNVTVKTPEGPKPVVVAVSPATEFTRYSPDNPKTPVPSHLADIQPGDQVRIIGEKSDDASTITAQKVYSGAFRTLGGTVASISPDGKALTIKNAGGNQPMEVTLSEASTVRRLPPELALRLAMRLNPTYKPVQAGAGPSGRPGGNAGGSPAYGAKAGEAAGGAQGSQPGTSAGPGGGMRRGGGDLSQMIERLPKIGVSDLKPGDAVIIAGTATGADNSHFAATTVIAGAEPILRAAPARQGQNQNIDWNLGMDAPAQQ